MSDRRVDPTQNDRRDVALLLCAAAPADAYIGPGAGFALLSSFLVLFTTIVIAILSILFWPFRLLWRLARGKKRAARCDRSAGHYRVRRPGSEPDRSLHARGVAAELQEVDEIRQLPPAADYLPGDLAGCVVLLQHWHSPRAPQHLRLSRSGSAHLPAGPFLVARGTGAPVSAFWPLSDSAGTARAAAAAEVEAVLGDPGRAPHLDTCCACRSRFRRTVSTARSSAPCAVPDLLGTQGTFFLFTTRPSGVRIKEGGIRIPVVIDGDRIETKVLGPRTRSEPTARRWSCLFAFVSIDREPWPKWISVAPASNSCPVV